MVTKTLKILKENRCIRDLGLRRSQLELGIAREVESDRNFHLGGRSFYFFDFDDNVAFLATPLVIFHKQTKKEALLNSGEFALVHQQIGVSGDYRDYEIDYDDVKGTFRYFRDRDLGLLERVLGKRQTFIKDLAEALTQEDFLWKGPSWSCFYHATFNQRPTSLITARGHHPDTIREGLELFVQSGYLPFAPNYLSLYPVSHKETRIALGDSELKMSTAELKQAAIRRSVEQAFAKYGENPHHRFGMSDDDPKNVELIIEEMARLKASYQENSFFVIETKGGEFIKKEVYKNYTIDKVVERGEQMSLFNESTS